MRPKGEGFLTSCGVLICSLGWGGSPTSSPQLLPSLLCSLPGAEGCLSQLVACGGQSSRSPQEGAGGEQVSSSLTHCPRDQIWQRTWRCVCNEANMIPLPRGLCHSTLPGSNLLQLAFWLPGFLEAPRYCLTETWLSEELRLPGKCYAGLNILQSVLVR